MCVCVCVCVCACVFHNSALPVRERGQTVTQPFSGDLDQTQSHTKLALLSAVYSCALVSEKMAVHEHLICFTWYSCVCRPVWPVAHSVVPNVIGWPRKKGPSAGSLAPRLGRANNCLTLLCSTHWLKRARLRDDPVTSF
ncbi:unnamed protein product [Protopolystoma xenopodis]|uniref:Secreted protein n=1 Tax=Protopolystoma xenopodis TaxID=117903 RepID=A0A3S5B9Y9_9PLAT|nr:unnamed protein product [Protopolystoma xenopodis]